MPTLTDLAEHLGLSRTVVGEMIREKKLPSYPKGQVNIDEARLIYIGRLREQAAGRLGSGDGDLDLTEERARKAKEEADRIEMQNKVMRGELLPREDVDAAVTGSFARVRARVIGLPTKVAPMVVGMENPAEIEAVVRKAANEALKELSETNVSDLCGYDSGLVEDTGTATGSDG